MTNIDEKRKKDTRNIFIFELFWFLMAQILGLVVSRNIIITHVVREGGEIPQVSPSEFSIPAFLISFFGVTLFIIFASQLTTGKNMVFRIFLTFVIFLGGEVFLESLYIPTIIALPIVLISIIIWFKNSSVWFHNLLLVVGIAGMGGVVGTSLSPQLVILLFIILAIYDFVAVYKTKHMVKMAKSMIESRAILGIVIPKNFIDFKKRLQDVEIGKEKKDCLILGSGDIIFPLILSASLLPQGIIKSGIILIFSIAGLFLGFILFLKLGQKPMPALPPLALSSIIGYAIAIAI